MLIKYTLVSLPKNDMKCPKCSSEKRTKSGIVKERQRHKCKECGCNYTVELKSTAKLQSLKKQTFGRFLGVGNVSVLKWIRNFEKLASENKEIEIDEMHSYIGSK